MGGRKNWTKNSISFKGKHTATKRDHKKSPGLASSQEIASRLIVDNRSIGDNTLKDAMTDATTLQQRHKELKETRGLGHFNEVYSSSAPSDFDTSYNESTWHCPMQPLPTK